MKKFFIIKIVKIIVKYVLPIIIGYIEGDTHAIEDGVSCLF